VALVASSVVTELAKTPTESLGAWFCHDGPQRAAWVLSEFPEVLSQQLIRPLPQVSASLRELCQFCRSGGGSVRRCG
jgi:hypothetical protein